MERIKSKSEDLNEEFFEIIDVDEGGKDDVLTQMEKDIEAVVNESIEFLLNLEDYNYRKELINNKNVKTVNLTYYSLSNVDK